MDHPGGSMSQQALRALIMLMPKSHSYATWNPSDKSASMGLSGGNLIATSSATNQGVRSTISKSSGKWYWEAKLVTTGARCGMATSAWSETTSLGVAANSWGYSNSGPILNNNVLLFNAAAWTTSDTIGFAYDPAAATLAFYKNNTLQYTATSVTSGMYPAVSLTLSAYALSANFGATALAYAPPAGFNAGMYL